MGAKFGKFGGRETYASSRHTDSFEACKIIAFANPVFPKVSALVLPAIRPDQGKPDVLTKAAGGGYGARSLPCFGFAFAASRAAPSATTKSTNATIGVATVSP